MTGRKRGRPKKQPEAKQEFNVDVYFTRAEYHALSRLSAEAGVPLSRLMRRMALHVLLDRRGASLLSRA